MAVAVITGSGGLIGSIEELCGKPLRFDLSVQARQGDHIWWISDVRKFRRNYSA